MIKQDSKRNSLKRKLCTIAMVGVIGATSIPAQAITYTDTDGKRVEIDEFRDVQNHWARTKIREWYEAEIVTGDDKGNFNPNANITRGDLSCIIDRLLGLTAIANNNFRDLPSTKYYTKSVLRMNASGLLAGNGLYLRPQDNATREEVVCILARAFKLDTSKVKGYTGFTDDYSVSSWAKPSVEAMSRLGYVGGVGNGKFEPKRPITRAEVVAIIDKMCEVYYSQSTSGRVFTNTSNGNSVVALGGVTLKRSVINGNLYLTNSASGTITLDATTISKDVVVLGDESTLKVGDNCEVNDLYCYGVTTVTGANKFGGVYVANFASGTTLDVVPDSLTLEPNTSVMFKNFALKNEESKAVTYTSLEVKNIMSKNSNTVDGGPVIETSKIAIDYANNVKATGVKLKTTGTSKLDELGVIWVKGKETPTLDDYDKKTVYKGNNIEGIDFDVTNQANDVIYTYRLYAINDEGLIGYTNPVTIRSYDYKINMFVTAINDGVRPEIHITGTNVPNIRSVAFKYDTDSVYTEGKATQIGTDDASVSKTNNQDYQNYRYSGDIRINGSDITPSFYGYIITFADAGTLDQFPILSNVTPESIKPVEELVTGTGRNVGTWVYVDDNKVKTNFNKIQEYGLIYKELSNETDSSTPDATSKAWTTKVIGTSLEDKTTKYFNSDFKISGNKDVCFASYVKTSNGYYYGDTKLIKIASAVDEGSATVSKVGVTRLSDTLAIVLMDYSSESPLNLSAYNSITNFKDHLGRLDSTYNGGSLSNANVWVSLDNKQLALVFDTLKAGCSYSGDVKLSNTMGISKSTSIAIPSSSVAPNVVVSSLNATSDIIDFNMFVNNTPVTLINATVDDYAQPVAGNEVVGYSVVTRSKLSKGNHTLECLVQYDLSKEQSNKKVFQYKVIKNFTVK